MDNTRCKKAVRSGTWHSFQCTRKVWKDGYCKQHHPESVRARDEKRDELWRKKMENSPWRQMEKKDKRIAELEAEVARLSTLNPMENRTGGTP